MPMQLNRVRQVSTQVTRAPAIAAANVMKPVLPKAKNPLRKGINPADPKMRKSVIAVEEAAKQEQVKKLLEIAAANGEVVGKDVKIAQRGSGPMFLRPIGESRAKDGCSEHSLSAREAYGEQLTEWVDDIIMTEPCIACQGTGKSSVGGRCVPCKGKGKVPATQTEDDINAQLASVNEQVNSYTFDEPTEEETTFEMLDRKLHTSGPAFPVPRTLITTTQAVVKNAITSGPMFLRPSPVKGGDGCHLVVSALAGTGKTFTIVNGAKQCIGMGDPDIKGSEQQEAIWQAMLKGPRPRTVHICAFNRSIAAEFKKHLPDMITASTCHSFGLKSIKKAGMKGKVTDQKTNFILCDWNADHRKQFRGLEYLADRVCSLIKGNLMDWTFEQVDAQTTLDFIVNKYQLEMDADNYSQLIELLPFLMSEHWHRTDIVDYSDMIWFPNVHPTCRVDKIDLLLVDECQDLNKAQQGMIKLAAKRAVLVGDRHQAIYGFTGADEEAMDHMKDDLAKSAIGCQELPLYETRRCPTEVIKLAQQIVPQFVGLPNAPAGQVIWKKEEDGLDHIGGKDMVICRTNAPIISQCLRFLRVGKKAHMQGRDIGEDIIRLIKKMDADCTLDLLDKLDDYYNDESTKIMNSRFGSEAKLIVLQDKVESVKAFADKTQEVDQIIKKVKDLFDDTKTEGTKFSSIHRCKGLEADTVVFWRHDTCPHPMAKTPEAKQQEKNLRYVGITRAKKCLQMYSQPVRPKVTQDEF